MTKEEIIEMARHADIDYHRLWNDDGTNRLEYFAKLVAEAEREACAKIVKESSLPDTYSQECLPEIANDIRARGQK